MIVDKNVGKKNPRVEFVTSASRVSVSGQRQLEMYDRDS